MTIHNPNTAPKIKDITTIDYMKPQLINLDNGIETYILKGGVAEVVQIDLIFEAGLACSDKNLLPAVSNALLKEAPVGMSPDDFSELLDFHGCIVQGFIGNKFGGIKIILQNIHAEKVLPKISEIVKNPLLPEKEFNIIKYNFNEKIKYNLEKNKFLAVKGFNTMLFGSNHPFGLETDEKSVHKINLFEVENFVKKYYSSANCRILVSGLANQRIINNIKKYFGRDNWGDSSKIMQNKFPISISQNKLKLIERESSLQSTIFMGKFLDIENYDDIYSISVLNTILGGYFGSRLMKNIREEKGYTYGIGSFITNFDEQYVLRITADVGVEYTQLTIDEIFKEIQKIQNSGITADELKLVKNYMMGDILNSFNGPFATAMMYKRLFEEPDYRTYIDNQIKTISSIGEDTIIKMANKYMKIEEFHTTIAGKLL